MAIVDARTVNFGDTFGLLLVDDLAELQRFVTQVIPTSTTARSYRASEDSAFATNLFLGEASFTGNFTYTRPTPTSADQVRGPISDFSFNYFSRDSLGQKTFVSGNYLVERLGKNSIDFVDFISLPTRQLASRIFKGNDRILGSSFSDKLEGFDGNDIIKGGDGERDEIFGGKGDDKLIGGKGTDIIDGGRGDDRLFGGNGIDILEGGPGNDRLFGGNNGDLLEGGAGDDILDQGKGFGRTIAGPGKDIIVFKNKSGYKTVVEDFQPLDDFIDIAGDGSNLGSLSVSQEGSSTVRLEYSRNNFLILESNQAFNIDDVNFI